MVPTGLDKYSEHVSRHNYTRIKCVDITWRYKNSTKFPEVKISVHQLSIRCIGYRGIWLARGRKKTQISGNRSIGEGWGKKGWRVIIRATLSSNQHSIECVYEVRLVHVVIPEQSLNVLYVNMLLDFNARATILQYVQKTTTEATVKTAHPPLMHQGGN